MNPTRIGGKRLTSELMRPHVIEFLDEMLKVTLGELHFDEVELVQGSNVVGKSLREVFAPTPVVGAPRADCQRSKACCVAAQNLRLTQKAAQSRFPDDVLRSIA